MTVTQLDVPHDPSISRWHCGCSGCRRMRQASRKTHAQLTQRGRVPLRTSVQDAIVLLDRWYSYGYTNLSIGAAIGLNHQWLSRLYKGESQFIDRRTVTGLQLLTHARLIASTDDAKWVPAIGALRRLQALTWRGWSPAALPISTSWGVQLLRNESRWCTAKLHRQAQAAFREYEMVDAPGMRAQKVRDRALSNGWLSPLAWDVETIDDPDAEPWGDSPAKLESRRAAFVENVDFLITAMVPVAEVVRRLAEFEPDGRLRLDQAEQRLRRAGNRGDARARELARLFNLELARSRRDQDAHVAS